MELNINNNNDEIIKPHEQNFLDDITKNGRFILSIGSKGSGKTYLMMAILKYCLHNNIAMLYMRFYQHTKGNKIIVTILLKIRNTFKYINIIMNQFVKKLMFRDARKKH